MVNDGFTNADAAVTSDWREAERRMLLSYASAGRRRALAALLALDDALAAVLRTTRDPMVGQLRLTWWHDALTRLDAAPPPAQPLLLALAAEVLPSGVGGGELAALVEGWEALLDDGALEDDVMLSAYAAARGEGLFRIAGRIIGAASNDPLVSAGRGWALADLAAHSRAPVRARQLATPLLKEAGGVRWSVAGRPLGAMMRLAAMPDAGPARRTLRALAHRLTGR